MAPRCFPARRIPSALPRGRRILGSFSGAALAGLSLLLPAVAPSQDAPGETGWTAHPLPSQAAAAAGFERLAPEQSGLTFTNRLGERAAAANRVLENGSGVAAGDVDGDGRIDLFFCGLEGNSALFRNLGHWKFTEVTSSAGLQRLTGEVCRGAVFADLNADRQTDLLVSTQDRGVLCFLNQGGRFLDATESAGTAGPAGSTTLALADVDGNGTPDLYVCRYRADDIRDSSRVEARRVGTRTELHPRYAGRLALRDTGLIEFGEPDLLYLNDGHARFREVPADAGMFLDAQGLPLPAPHRDWGLSASLRDLTGDGRPDLYVCNDYWTPDRFWIQTVAGQFQLAPAELLQPLSENSMGLDAADLDRDGLTDFLVLDMLDPDPVVRRRQALAQSRAESLPSEGDPRPQVMRNTLFRARADGTFAEIAEIAGLARTGWSWQPTFLDVDLDGWDDVLIPTGHRQDVQDLDATEQILRLQQPFPPQLTPEARQETFLRRKLEHARLYPPLEGPIHAYRNLGNLRFASMTSAWHLDHPGVHQGTALADLDQDGDLDLVVNPLNGAAGLYRNLSSAPRIAVRLQGAAPNTDALGARVRLLSAPVLPQSREIIAGGRYLSGSDRLVCFAASHVSNSSTLEILWRDGSVSRIPNPRPDHLYQVEETRIPRSPAAPRIPPVPPLLEPARLAAVPAPLLPATPPVEVAPLAGRPFSYGGPGLSVTDLNQDGWPDLRVGTAPGLPPQVWTNDTRGGFAFSPEASLNPTPPLPAPYPAAVLPAFAPMALGQPDPRGPLHLAVGGEVVPGRYPETAPTRILKLVDGAWLPDAANTETLRDVGITRDAAWADLDGDGDSDLLLACEWSPIRAFRSDQGRLVDVTAAWGFESFPGLWLGLTVADLDADGRLDVIAGNWGLNASLAASSHQPLALVHGDLLGRETVDAFIAEWDPARQRLAPRERLTEWESLLPPVRALFPTHRAFVNASLEEVIRAFGHETRQRVVTTLASTAFLRRGDRFESQPLPDEAQFAPVFGLQSADFDGDQRPDLALAQNASRLPWPEPPLVAGQGLILRGLGGGRFEPLASGVSGVHLSGEQRGLAVADFNRDGRPDLAIAQPSSPPAVFLNRHGPSGLRIRLDGPAQNPLGLGATVRLVGNNFSGPAMAMLGGSGRGSMNPPSLVIAPPPSTAQEPRLDVSWPDGRVTSHPVPIETRTDLLILHATGATSRSE